MNSYMPTNQITKVSWTNSQKHKTAKTRGGEKKKKENLNRPIKNKQLIIKNFSTKKAQDKILHW